MIKIEKVGSEEVAAAIKSNDGYCICATEKTIDTQCMCKEFRETTETCICHCGLYKKTITED